MSAGAEAEEDWLVVVVVILELGCSLSIHSHQHISTPPTSAATVCASVLQLGQVVWLVKIIKTKPPVNENLCGQMYSTDT